MTRYSVQKLTKMNILHVFVEIGVAFGLKFIVRSCQGFVLSGELETRRDLSDMNSERT